MFPSISPKQSFPTLESEILAYWKSNNTFQKSIDSRPEDNPYRFYDGPPFITGTPHYGSLLSSVVKDVVGRYWTMRGKRVDRVWGWDCHGLPIEEKVQKKLGLSSNKEIEERGVKEFIDGCYEYTESTSAEWEWYIDKIGRWVDMDRAYRTMDQDYMESVMWVFRQLWDKGLIYEGKRVSLYSWKLSTPISNFEVAMDDTYQDVNDPAITVKFRLDTNDIFPANTAILAWTTTPWTIPANMALGVGEDIDYVLVENNSEQFIVAKNRAETVFKGKGDYSVVREFKGRDLVGISYTPPFPEYYHTNTGDKTHKIYAADFATDTDGTGIVHLAPEFGDVDFQLAKKEGIPVTEAMDEAGKYTDEIFDYAGTHYLDANRINIDRMKENGTLFKNESITHRVPFCPRSGTPLVQKAQSSWFIDIQSQKEKLLEANKKINWFPEHLKFGRFAKGVESAPDWCISRTRFWGAPMPVWMGDDGEKVVVSSREEIFELNKPYGQLTKIIFVRHGRTDYNGIKPDVIGKAKLIDDGLLHIEKLKVALGETKIDAIYSSPLQRCVDTINPIAKAKDIPVTIDNDLIEFQILSSQEQRVSDFDDQVLTTAIHKDGDETLQELFDRTEKFLKKVVSENAGKTVVVCSHFATISALQKHLHNFNWDKEWKNFAPTNLTTKKGYSPLKVDYIFSDSCTPLNLHRPYIDSILLAPKNAQKPKKVLGIHGFKRTEAVVDFFEGTKKNLEKEGIQMDAPVFEIGENINYKNWNSILEGLFSKEKYDTILTHSMGSRVAIEYIVKNKISLNRLILVSPAQGSNRPEIISFYEGMKEDISETKKYVKEIIILHSKDDTIHTIEQSKEFAEVTGGKLVIVDGFGHFNLHECKLIEDTIIGKPKPKKVLGIHGWMSDGINEGIEDFWFMLKERLLGDNIDLDVPNFDKNQETSYFLWREKLDTLNVSQYDTIVAHSFGCAVIIQYIVENSLNLDRLVLVAPSGLLGNSFLEKIIPEMTANKLELKKLVKDIIILHSVDDNSKSAPYTYGKSLAEDINAKLIAVNGYSHDFLGAGYKIIAGLVKLGSPLTRVKEVLDVWMDSGSMPYAQVHYPFENREAMEASFPADFIAEYVGQVRAWFYVMHVLGVLLNPNNESTPTPSFTNVITTGVINGNDGRKMSKSYGNYPDPRDTIEKYGADPIRFYMLNSPLLSGGDMDFKEEGIIETIKSVMLPLWNTYSFFTTYANIDTWEKDGTEVWFTRHGETEHNLKQIMNGGDVDTPLNDTGREQAKQSGIDAKKRGISFDIIISSPLSRARETAQIMADETGYIGEIIVNEGLLEQLSGKYAGKTIEEIGNEIGSQNVEDIRRAYKENNGVEDIEEFEGRVIPAFREILEKYKGKRILLVAHTGTFRPIKRYVTRTSKESAHYTPSIPHTELISIPTTPLTNPLDRWILSRLQVLLGNVHDAMDGYDISRACRAIVEYMDELTNWYVRLSRRRFWESGMTADKESAYETLYTVLVEVSKLLAPFMPFLAESIFQGLTKKESVHLEYVTLPNRHLVDTNLNRDMQICEQIVSLGLALRSAKNIRVRQPLWSITVTKELDEYYQNIIRDELNVKQVRFENPEKLAKKICKPDARKIGPRFGKDVQYIITEAKNGNFTELEDGKVQVGNFTLEAGEYIIEYLPLENVGDVMGGYGMVVALDTTIDEDLKLEGYARDIIRLIQDLRKDANYNVTDRITLSLSGEVISPILEKFGHLITMETLSEFGEIASGDREKTEYLDENLNITIKVKR